MTNPLSWRVAPWVALILAACPKKDPAADVTPRDLSVKSSPPAPLPEVPFQAPKVERRTLSNGLPVIIATNDEVPLVDISFAFRIGAWHEPKPGVAAVTLDLMNDGAGDMSAEQISAKLKALASDISTGAGVDGATINLSSLSRNLDPTLDIAEAIIKRPTFPEEEWKLAKPRYVSGVQLVRKDASRIASRVEGRLVYGPNYRGKIVMESDYDTLTVDDLKKFHATYFGPENGIILVGGAISADEAVKALEPRFGTWKPAGVQVAPVDIKPLAVEKPLLYLVDKPGASQSAISARTVVGQATDPDWYALQLGIDVLGGTFMSRLNMNLREDKGYTYGARCGSGVRLGPSIVSCSALVQTAVTVPALIEMRKELAQIHQERPITESELAYMKDTIVNGYAGRFETSGALLGEQESIWRYGLAKDLPDTYLSSIRAVDVAAAQAAVKARWSPERTIWLVVGDKAKIQAELQGLGLPIIELDADGNKVGG